MNHIVFWGKSGKNIEIKLPRRSPSKSNLQRLNGSGFGVGRNDHNVGSLHEERKRDKI